MNGARAQRGDHSGPSLRAYTGYNPDEAGLMRCHRMAPGWERG